MPTMRSITMTSILLFAVAGTAAAQGTAARTTPVDDGIRWGPAPAVFPAGAQMAVLQGDPGSKAMFTVRLRLPDGYRLAPHTHPTDEHVTVISGTFRVGMGKQAVARELMTLRAGGWVIAPADHPHYAVAQGETVVQVHAMGPFAMTYVKPEDTPRAAASR
jgi:quercetin dioxygenase-like cupin family protein